MSKKPNKKRQTDLERANETLTALLSTDTKTAAAELLGINRTTLYERIEKFNLQDYLNMYYEDAISVLGKGTVNAAKKQVKLTESKNEKIALEASAEVLDRAGITKKQSNTTNVQVNIANVLDKEKEVYNLDE